VGAGREDGSLCGDGASAARSAARARRHRVRQAERNLQWVRADALVFTTMRGKPQSRRNVLRALHNAGANLSLNGDGVEPVGLHDLRQSFIAAAFEQGLPVPGIAALARHANPR
jgi:integrase